MVRDLASSGYRSVAWLGKKINQALSDGLSRVAGIAQSVWGGTSPHFEKVETTTPKALQEAAKRPRRRPSRRIRQNQLIGVNTRGSTVRPVPPGTAEWYATNPSRK